MHRKSYPLKFYVSNPQQITGRKLRSESTIGAGKPINYNNKKGRKIERKITDVSQNKK